MTLDWKTLPSLSALRAFEAVARCGSLSGAGRELNVTHAAVGQQVRALEAEIGSKLIRRQGRGIVLTEAGQELSEPIKRGFSTLAEGVMIAREADAKREVRVTTTTFFGDAVIMPNLTEFWAKHPGIHVTFTPNGCVSPVDMDGFDFGIRTKCGSWPGYDDLPLTTCDLVVTGAPTLVGDGKIDPHSIPWIRDAEWVEKGADALLATAGIDASKLEFVDPGNPSYLIEAALHGYGVCLSSEVITRRHIEAGTLVRLDVTFAEISEYFAIFPSGPIREPAKKFLEWLRAVMR